MLSLVGVYDVTLILCTMFYVNTTSITNITDLGATLGLTASTKGILICYNVLVIILALLGNGVVLFGSLKHNAIKMDKVCLILIQNIAFTDIVIGLVAYLPRVIILSANKWVLGKFMCGLSAFLENIPPTNEIFCKTVTSLYRLIYL